MKSEKLIKYTKSKYYQAKKGYKSIKHYKEKSTHYPKLKIKNFYGL